MRDPSLRRAVSLALERGDLAAAGRGVAAGDDDPLRRPRTSACKGAVRGAGSGTSPRRRPFGTLHLIIVPDIPELARVAELVRRDLARVGINVVIRTDPEALPLAGDPKQGIDLVPLGWAMDYPDPGNAVRKCSL